MPQDPTWGTLREEFELVVSRHHELLEPDPAYFAATCYHLADLIRAKYHVPITDVTDEGDGLYLVHLKDGTHVAGLGIVDQPERMADIDAVVGPGGGFLE